MVWKFQWTIYIYSIWRTLGKLLEKTAGIRMKEEEMDGDSVDFSEEGVNGKVLREGRKGVKGR